MENVLAIRHNKRKREDEVDDDGVDIPILGPHFLKTRMSPKHLVTFINSNPSENQVNDIKSMGFGGLLTLKTDKVPGLLAHWLVSTFDTCSCSLMGGQLPITDEDIHLATGLPIGPNEVLLASTQDKSEGFLEVKRNFLGQFANSPSVVDRSKLLELIISQKEGGEDFKRNFVVFAASDFLMGSKGNVASLRILMSLHDMSLVSSFNWCHLTRKHLIEEIDLWKESHKSNPTPTFGGPIMVLVFIYLDRVAFKFHTHDRFFPTLSSWTKKAVSSRVNVEKVNGFGKGAVLSRIVKPAVDDPTFQLPSAPTTTSGPSVHEAKASKKDDATNFSFQKLADATNLLTTVWEQFYEALSEAKIQRPTCDVVRHIASMVESLCQPMKNEAYDIKGKKVNSDDENVQKGANDDYSDEVMAARREFEKSTFANDDELWEAVAKLEAAFAKRHASTSGPKKFENQEEQNKSKMGDESKVLVDSEVVGKQCTSLRRSPRFSSSPQITPPEPADIDFSPPSFKLISSQDLDVPTHVGNPSTSKTPIASLPPIPTHRNRVPTEVFRSPFLERNVRVFGDLNNVEKEVLEFAFKEGSDDGDIIFTCGEHTLSRRDLKTMTMDENISELVLKSWCLLLNKNEKFKSRESPLRFYMPYSTTEEATFDIEDDLKEAKLIFVPVMSPKPHVFCFNFLSSKLEVIHMHVDKYSSLKYSTHVKSMRDFVVKCLQKKIPSIESIFSQRVEDFVPKSRLGIVNDKGVYLLRVLETYKGCRKGYSLGIHNEHQRKLFSARVCYQLLTSNDNCLKESILHESHLSKQDLDIATPTLFQYTDEELIGFVINNCKEREYLDEILVETEWMQVTRKALRSLSPRTWIMDLVLDMFGVMSTLNRVDVLYLPTTSKFVRDKVKRNVKNVWGPFLKSHYMPKNGSAIDKVFITIGDGEHWIAVVSDITMKKNLILDSMISPNVEDLAKWNTLIDNIIGGCESAFGQNNGYNRLSGMSSFQKEIVEVPQQKNCYDCGVYVMKFLEATLDNELWTDTRHFDARCFRAYRQSIMLRLLKWERNIRKIFP